ncbi:MAG: hypothetical protein M3418_08165, partial [Gemmatimonadota bacterium]|nr:hypothetical protein [Gemmatimonadota bacterium]
PRSAQPGNSHRLSVHPTGMAVDLRISNSAACRAWLESVLLSLESKGLLDVTREQRPPHYHIAVFPEPYRAHIARLEADSLGAALATGDVRTPETTGAASLAALPRVSGFTAAGGHGAEGTGSRLGALLVVGMLYGGLGWGLILRRRRS